MGLSEQEIGWINWVAGKGITQDTQREEIAKGAARDAFLTGVVAGKLAAVSTEIDDAQRLIVRREEDPGLMTAIYRKLAGSDAKDFSEMKWRAGDEDTNRGILDLYQLRADVEVDSKADIDEKVQNIPNEDLMRLAQSFERIKQIETSMKMQLDDGGEPLFTDEDIRTELWTPLVRSGLIPDNMVPDLYSEHAVNFAGARSFYEDKIAAHTASTTKAQERWGKGLQIAKDVAALGGALTTGAITIANAPDIARNTEEITQKTKQVQQLGDSDPTRKLDLENQISALKEANTRLQDMSTYAEAGTAVLLGGVSMVEIGVEQYYSKDPDTLKKWTTTIQKGVQLAQTLSVNAVTAGMTAQKADTGMITCVTSALDAAFTGVKLAPSLVLTVKETDPDKQAAMISSMVSDFASGVASSINAVGGRVSVLTSEEKKLPEAEKDKVKQDRANLQAAMGQISAALKVGIVQAGLAPAIIRAYKSDDIRGLGLLLGGAATATVFSLSSDEVFKITHETVSAEDYLEAGTFEQNFMEKAGSGLEAGRDKGSADIMSGVGSSVAALDGAVLAGLKPGLLDNIAASELQDSIAGDVAAAQKQIAQDKLDEMFSPEGLQSLMSEVDAQLVGFEQTYSDARPDPDIAKRKPEEIVQAQLAIEQAIMNTTELRQKVAIINAVTGGAAGVIAALVPGAGAAVAAQKVAMDIYALVKCVETHNAWVESMELALAGQSGAAAAIQNTLVNARIHLSQASVKLVLDSVQCGAQVARAFDPSGAATITAAGVGMASAVVDFGYKMQKEADIIHGWNAYKAALEAPGNRKAARRALRLNSTLAKCSIAYGAAIVGDPVAKEAVRATGLTVAALQNDKDVCVKLISYLETQLADDPTVLKVSYKGDTTWHPGTPRLDLASWAAFKGAANKEASPRMVAEGLSTPGIDRLFVTLAKSTAWPMSDDDMSAFRQDAGKIRDLADGRMTVDEAEVFRPRDAEARQSVRARSDELAKVLGYLDRIEAGFASYAPPADGPGSLPHDGMVQVAQTFAALARAERATVAARQAELAIPG